MPRAAAARHPDPAGVDLGDQGVIHGGEAADPPLHAGHQLDEFLVATTAQLQGGQPVQDVVEAGEQAAAAAPPRLASYMYSILRTRSDSFDVIHRPLRYSPKSSTQFTRSANYSPQTQADDATRPETNVLVAASFHNAPTLEARQSPRKRTWR